MKWLILFFVFFTRVGAAQTFQTESGNVNFLSKAPLSEFNGVSNKLHGLIDLSQNVLDFYIDLNTLETGIGLRDKHMRDNYLETKKYPFAELTGKMTSIPSLTTGSKSIVVAVGKFKMHGVDKEIEVRGTLSKISSGELELVADFEILLSDYDIPVPKLVFYELAEKQVISIKAILKPK
ncbi:YceI-like domain-containing protein [Algoriphagus ratkowskyi]|uniref:YceI family protein n=1 Tax=Algoriphagus ratkowskyi TaxID=57028 RepID=A0A2W7RCH8_9BACT|nr:YceI family protein [Algoriphagus ratkowskyi]PZX56826.1 YceI-like domain-containing protein [Algoriphagus ratkowskyi]TXD79742.1 YceI family protein [Algoriphagus ratkowskyi]